MGGRTRAGNRSGFQCGAENGKGLDAHIQALDFGGRPYWI